MKEIIQKTSEQIANNTDLQHNKKRYIIYRNGNTEKPDEIIETDNQIQAELVNRLASDPTITRVDLEIIQVFTWRDYIKFRDTVKSTAAELSKAD